MIRLCALLLALMVALFLIGIMISPAVAHEWYDPICCSDRDCAPLPPGSVVATPQGWRVTLTAGDHPALTQRMVKVIPYDAGAIRESMDGYFHACIVPRSTHIRCLYVPPFGS